MNRSPLFYPLNRGMDADPGGAADLQTDVMRFMAILSMCLVAIFALVQSMPLAPEVPVEPDAVVELPPPPPADELEKPRQSVVLTRPAAAGKAPKQEPVVLRRPQATPARDAPQVAKAAVPAPAATPRPAARPRGFTLRFASDRALTRLVERNVVRLYAIAGGETRKLAIDSGRLSFWTAAAPDKLHDMDASTVPAAILDAWRRSGADTKPAVRWGVSLPPALSRQISAYLASTDGGSLIIEQDGSMKLEQ